MMYWDPDMIKHLRLTGLLVVLMSLYATSGFAQEVEAEVPTDQEVEVNEDNYRQFMELRDALRQRNIMPENSYQSQAGLQKLDKLPEDSQKHLRNQLREIILQGDQWQPGDEDGDYPYVPSVAAATNHPLQKKEAEAWGELVGNYHTREAEIYANSARSRAAAATGAPGTGTGTKNSDGTSTDGKEQGDTGEQAGQPGSSDSAADSYSPGSAGDPNARGSEGVSQSAMEYLKNNQQTLANADGSNAEPTDGDNDNSGEQSGDARQNATYQALATIAPASQTSTNESNTESTEGVSQNALEFLKGEIAQQGQQNTVDTLTIEDLMNAQGISIRLGVGTGTGGTKDEEESEQEKPDRDGGD
jgi:hypothetical protein